MRFELNDVVITSYNTSGASASSEPPTVDLTIAYEPIKVSYSRDELDFPAGNGEAEKPNFEWIEIKAPPKPPSQPLPLFDDLDELILIENDGQDPLAGLLLPAVQAAGFIVRDDTRDTPVWDDFIFG
jgi:hypothetical protein